jgi:CRP-like cAMP-binding protein
VAARLSAAVEESRPATGEVLVREGEPVEKLHFIVSGGAAVVREGSKPLLVGPGSLIGLLDANIPRPHRWTVTAEHDTHVLSVGYLDYLDVLEENFGFAVDTLAVGARNQSALAQRAGPEAFAPAHDGEFPVAALRGLEQDEMGRVLVLRGAGLFRAAPVQSLIVLSRLAQVQEWPPGARLFEPGEPIEYLRVVARGTAKVHSTRWRDSTTSGPYDLVAGLESVGHSEHQFGVTSQSVLTTLEIDLEDLFDVAEDHFGLFTAMLSHVSGERVRLGDVLSQKDLEVGRTTL